VEKSDSVLLATRKSEQESKFNLGSGYSTGSGLLEKMFKNRIACFSIVML